MTINSTPAMSLVESALTAENSRADVGVTMLKKAQDLEKQQGEALVKMLEQSTPVVNGRLDAYA
jgi:hypothetical protein